MLVPAFFVCGILGHYFENVGQLCSKQQTHNTCRRDCGTECTVYRNKPEIESHIKEMEEVLYGLIMYSMTGSKEDMFEICDSKELIAQSLRNLPSHIRI